MKIRRLTDQTKNLTMTLTETDVAAIQAGLDRSPDDDHKLDEIANAVGGLEFHEDSKTFTGEVSPRIARAMLVAAAIGTASGNVDWRSWASLTSFRESTSIITLADKHGILSGDAIIVHNNTVGNETTIHSNNPVDAASHATAIIAADPSNIKTDGDLAAKLREIGYDAEPIEVADITLPGVEYDHSDEIKSLRKAGRI